MLFPTKGSGLPQRHRSLTSAALIAAALALALPLTGCVQALTNPGKLAKWERALGEFDFLDTDSMMSSLNGISNLDADAFLAISPEITDAQLAQLAEVSCANSVKAGVIIQVDQRARAGTPPRNELFSPNGEISELVVQPDLCFTAGSVRTFLTYLDVAMNDPATIDTEGEPSDPFLSATIWRDATAETFDFVETNSPAAYDQVLADAQSGQLAVTRNGFSLDEVRIKAAQSDGSDSWGTVPWRTFDLQAGRQTHRLSEQAQAEIGSVETQRKNTEVLEAVNRVIDSHGILTDSQVFSDDGRWLTITLSADNEVNDGFSLEDVSLALFAELRDLPELSDIDVVVTYPGDPG